MWWRSVFWIGLIFGSMAFLVPNILWLVSSLVAKLASYRVPYAPFGWTALALMLIVWVSLAYGHYVGRLKLAVNTVEYASTEVPKAFDGYRVVHISDLHADSFDDNPEALQRIVDSVNAQNADVILFTGDMNTSDMNNLRQHEGVLKQLKARDGVVSVLGNHDFFIYNFSDNRQRCAAADTLTAYEREVLGWKVLRNESLLLHRNNDSLAIAGCDNIHGKQGFVTIQKGDLKKAMNGLDGVFTILMTHDPSHWRAEVLPKSHAQITLSGHTHAAQVRLFGWSLANLSFDECDGAYYQDGRLLYVSAGLGCTAPFRIDCPSEITVIKLASK